MTAPFTCSDREISLCLLLETSCQRPPLQVVSVSTAHKSQYFWLLCHSSGAWGVAWAVGLSSMADVEGLHLTPVCCCCSMLESLNGVGFFWFFILCTSLFLAFSPSLPKKCYFLLFSLRKGMSRAQRNTVSYLNLAVGLLFLALSGVN